MDKDTAISTAIKHFNKTGEKAFVVHDPDYYKDIFANTGFKVMRIVPGYLKQSIVYEAK